ncbi:hypothetical protein ACF07T_19420 [Streptomyces sp. NPDC015184]|uniref:hypothetical protein n=1 Tax=Streptomyces sp. NPDC015184 TaxID=3364946 RepID=UPI0036F97A9B
MFRSSLSRRHAGAARTAAVTGLVLVSLALSTGAATAADTGSPAPRNPAVGDVGAFCERVAAVTDRLPLPSAPATVCKLVNGWD